MPNHGPANPKPKTIPSGAKLGPFDIIGYTPADPARGKPKPTVYFTLGHLTIWHKHPWNIGWEDCAGWTPLFFGNVLQAEEQRGTFHSHDNNGLVPSATYVEKLESHGHNRVIGRPPTSLGSWDLQRRDERIVGEDCILREFWIRGQGASERDRFAHPSRGPFIPISASSSAKRNEMWQHVQDYHVQQNGAAARQGAPASSSANRPVKSGPVRRHP
jgi:hypothetical protein